MITPEHIKSFRKGMGWSQQELASRLGIDQATVSRIERGAASPSGPLKRLLEMLMADSPLQKEGAA